MIMLRASEHSEESKVKNFPSYDLAKSWTYDTRAQNKSPSTRKKVKSKISPPMILQKVGRTTQELKTRVQVIVHNCKLKGV